MFSIVLEVAILRISCSSLFAFVGYGFYFESAWRGFPLCRGTLISVNPFFRFLLCRALALWSLLGLCDSVGLFFYYIRLVVFHNV